ncbi:MAG: putative Ig domain-containing protein [Verrucomicrobia bacterium]|nr:putative Ig domain-containing protein [Verrucomicrobiota bacterium]MDE3099341.1 putative Ig domain-containing protein [Verrucomicrobiota bacterium]
MKFISQVFLLPMLLLPLSLAAQAPAVDRTPAAGTVSGSGGVIRTPPAPATPRINGPDIFGVRPDHPFLYHIPTTGKPPIRYSADDLPKGLALDARMGNFTGTIQGATDGDSFTVTLHAKNALGEDSKKFKIVVGETISLTPAMGWNSWNHYGSRITQAIVLENAKAMADSGLIHHGWTYVNIDDTWQGKRGGRYHGLQGNKKFPDIGRLCDQIHAMGLKFGIYSTPWETSYAGFPGGSSDNSQGNWTKPTGRKHVNHNVPPWAIGPYQFWTNDADQWAAWGVDYLKYDWNPIELPETEAMYEALRQSGRDIIFSLSNNMNVKNAPTIGKIANSWRTTGDIKANWWSLVIHIMAQVKWADYSSPGHWNDPDMLEIGTREHGQPGLSADEEYTHMTAWCLLASPLLLGNDLTQMDPFTLSLLENDEVLAVDQDELGRQAVPVSQTGEPVEVPRPGNRGKPFKVTPLQVWARPLADGSKAVGLFNFGDTPAKMTVKWSDLGISGPHKVRDLWREKELGSVADEFSMTVAPHGAEMIKVHE